jgi:hypothetical protein
LDHLREREQRGAAALGVIRSERERGAARRVVAPVEVDLVEHTTYVIVTRRRKEKEPRWRLGRFRAPRRNTASRRRRGDARHRIAADSRRVTLGLATYGA